MTSPDNDIMTTLPDAVEETPQWNVALRMFGLALLVAIGAFFALLFAPVIETVLLAFVFAFIFHAVVRLAVRRYHRLQYGVTTVTLYLAVAILFLMAIVSFGSDLLENGKSVIESVQGAASAINSGSPVSGISDDITDALQSAGIPDAAQVTTSILQSIVSRLSWGLSSLVGFVGMVGIALIFAFMLQMAIYSRKQGALSWVPPSYVREVTVMMSKLDNTWAGYLIAGVAFASVLALLSLIQYELMGVPYALVLAILTGFLTLIPSIGGLLASVVVFFACLTLGSTVITGIDNAAFALLVLLINVPITQGTYYFVGLPLTGRGVHLPIAIVFIGSLAGLSTGSLLIAWLTVPMIATMRIFSSYLLAKVSGRTAFPGEEIPVGAENGFLSRMFSPSPDTDVEGIPEHTPQTIEQPAG
jgi:predicted PurR-regulated permease PerM